MGTSSFFPSRCHSGPFTSRARCSANKISGLAGCTLRGRATMEMAYEQFNGSQAWLVSPFDLNGSVVAANSSNQTEPYYDMNSNAVLTFIYFVVCIIGLCGNTLVIYVILRYAKMKTITNIYILNLAIADELFMLGLPFLAMQVALVHWPFGKAICRVVMTVDGINQFTSIFCLTVMSIDRYTWPWSTLSSRPSGGDPGRPR